MNVLLDMPVSPSLADVLKARGHQAVHAFQLGMDRATDADLLEWARRMVGIVITADLDFPRLLALSAALGPGLIIFRGGNYSDAEMRDLLERVLDTVPPRVLLTSVCVVDQTRIRVTPLPLTHSARALRQN